MRDRIRPGREMWLEPRRRLRLLRWRWQRLWQLHNRRLISQLPQRLLLRLHHPQLRHPQRLPRELRNPRRGPRRPPGTVSPNEVRADKSNRRKVSQDPVKRAGAGHIDMNNVLVKIRKIGREGFNSPEAIAVRSAFGKVMDGLASARMVLGRARMVLGGRGFSRALRDGSLST